MKKIHDNVGDDTTKDNNSEDDFHLSLADDEDEADDDINFNPLNKTNSNVAQATPSLESGTYIIHILKIPNLMELYILEDKGQ